MQMRRLIPIILSGALALAAAPGGAHPHVFVAGGAHFGLDDQGRLERLHISWIYDIYASLYMLSFLEIDQDGDQMLSEEDKAKILEDQTKWPDEFAGDSYLFINGEKQSLGKPVNADTRILEDGRIEVRFDRLLAEPFRPGVNGAPEAVVKLYDPTFYYAYEVSDPPKVRAPDGHGCTTEFNPYDPSDPVLAALAVELSALGVDETPDQEEVGALFADELRLSCG